MQSGNRAQMTRGKLWDDRIQIPESPAKTSYLLRNNRMTSCRRHHTKAITGSKRTRIDTKLGDSSNETTMSHWNLPGSPEKISEHPGTKNIIFPRKILRNHKTQLGCSKHNGTLPNSRISIIAPLWHLELTRTIPRIFQRVKTQKFYFSRLITTKTQILHNLLESKPNLTKIYRTSNLSAMEL